MGANKSRFGAGSSLCGPANSYGDAGEGTSSGKEGRASGDPPAKSKGEAAITGGVSKDCVADDAGSMVRVEGSGVADGGEGRQDSRGSGGSGRGSGVFDKEGHAGGRVDGRGDKFDDDSDGTADDFDNDEIVTTADRGTTMQEGATVEGHGPTAAAAAAAAADDPTESVKPAAACRVSAAFQGRAKEQRMPPKEGLRARSTGKPATGRVPDGEEGTGGDTNGSAGSVGRSDSFPTRGSATKSRRMMGEASVANSSQGVVSCIVDSLREGGGVEGLSGGKGGGGGNSRPRESSMFRGILFVVHGTGLDDQEQKRAASLIDRCRCLHAGIG